MSSQVQNSVRVLGPIPVKYYLSFDRKSVQRPGARMVELQWRQTYAFRNTRIPVIKMGPGLDPYVGVAILEIWREPRKYIRFDDCPMKYPESRTIIKLYRPRNPDTRPKAIFVAVEYPLRSTGMGARDDADIIDNGGILWRFSADNTSRSGNHGKRLFLVVSEKPIKIWWESISNRGNRRAGIDVYGFDGTKTVPEMEELEVVKSWSYGKAVKMRNNLTGEVFTALILEFHRARKTSAMTDHVIEPSDAVELIESDAHGSKTHWTEIYKVIKPCKVTSIRVTNCGNRYEETVEISP